MDGNDLPSPAVDLSPYRRTNTHSCTVFPGENIVGQIYTGFGFVKKGDTFFSALVNVNLTHYEASTAVTDLPNTVSLAVETVTADRFARYQAGGSEGFYLSEKVRIPQNATKLTVNTAAQNGSSRVEILNAITGDPIDGFSKADSIPFTTDTKEGEEAQWQSRNISELAGQNCQIKFYMQSASLYAWRFE